jgi:hypothetical protein
MGCGVFDVLIHLEEVEGRREEREGRSRVRRLGGRQKRKRGVKGSLPAKKGEDG